MQKAPSGRAVEWPSTITYTVTMTAIPDKRGRFGPFGGRYVPETLIPALDELTAVYQKARRDPKFRHELDYYLREYVGRPTPLYYAERLTKKLGGAKIYLKREDLCHTGAHKINNTMGQVLLARRMKKPRVIAETGAGQHGVAVATVAAMFGLQCEVYMGTEDMERQALNVFRMRLLGTTVTGVNAGSRTLKDAISEAMRDWTTNVRTTHYILGSVLSNAIGLFTAFLKDRRVKMVGVEAGGLGLSSGKHAARFASGSVGVLQGTMTYLLQDGDGQIQLTHSVSAGLDYAAVGPEHALYQERGRIAYTSVTDDEAIAAFDLLAQTEGIMPALESAHAVAHVVKFAPTLTRSQAILVNLSGRGDKDVHQIARMKGVTI